MQGESVDMDTANHRKQTVGQQVTEKQPVQDSSGGPPNLSPTQAEDRRSIPSSEAEGQPRTGESVIESRISQSGLRHTGQSTRGSAGEVET